MMCYFPCGSYFPGNKKGILSGWMRPHGPQYYVIMQIHYLQKFPRLHQKSSKVAVVLS